MKQRMLLYGFTLLLGVFALSSCVNEDSVCLPDGSDVKVAFSLVLPENAQTRAAWSAEYDKELGVDYDNYIDLNGIQVLVFENTQTGAYVGTIDDFIYSKTGTNVYTYYGTAPSDLNPIGTYKFVVLANCSEVTFPENNKTISALNNITYTLANMNYIPMWGVHTKKLDLKPGQQYNIGDIDLLRAMSKVTVQLSDNLITDGYTLQSITVDKYNTSGYVLPKDASGYAETTALDQETCINVLPSLPSQDADPLTFEGDANNTVVFYLPEYANATSKDATLSVVLKYKKEIETEEGESSETGEDSEDVQYEEIPLEFPQGIEFKNYKDGKAFDIVRNHHYIFTITGVGTTLKLDVLTVPWTDEKINLQYTETVSWSSGGAPEWTPTLTPQNSGTETIDGVDYTVLYTNGGDVAFCTFTLIEPEGWLWYAQLEPLTVDADSYITFADNSTMISGTVGQEATLSFKIATGNTTSTQKSRLRLFVRTPSGDKSLEVRTLKFVISRNS